MSSFFRDFTLSFLIRLYQDGYATVVSGDLHEVLDVVYEGGQAHD